MSDSCTKSSRRMCCISIELGLIKALDSLSPSWLSHHLSCHQVHRGSRRNPCWVVYTMTIVAPHNFATDEAGSQHGNVTLLASMSLNGLQAAMTLEGAADEAAFEMFVQKVLLPTLRPGQVVIMDNLSSHKTERVEQLVTQAGCQLLFLPAYSPDLSPIEEAFSKLKAFLRRCRCKTMPALLDAIARGLDEITDRDAQAWFAHAGFSV